MIRCFLRVTRSSLLALRPVTCLLTPWLFFWAFFAWGWRVRNIFTHVPAYGDVLEVLWGILWYKDSLLVRHTSPFFTPLVFHPVGWHTATLAHTPVLFIVAQPLALLGGAALAYNTLAILALVLAFGGIYRYTRLFASGVAAILPALAFVMWRMCWDRVNGHLHMAWVSALLPWMAWALEEARRSDPMARKWTIMIGVIWGIMINFALYGAPIGMVAFVLWGRQMFRLRRLKQGMIAGLVALFCGLPTIVPYLWGSYHDITIAFSALGIVNIAQGEPTVLPAYISPNWSRQLSGGIIEDSSPTLYDLDGDGRLEIIISTTNKRYVSGQMDKNASSVLAVLEDDGTIKWQATLDDPVYSSPAVADISYPPDGIPEIIVTTGGDVEVCRGSIIAFRRDGTQLWRYDTNDAQRTGTPCGNWSSPTVGDLDGDGDMEIVFGSWDRNIYMLNHNGQYVWHYHVADSVWSTAALADLDRDGDLEIIIGTDITGGGVLPDGYRPTDGGFVLILDKDGHKLARRQMNEAIYSSPAVGDVDGDGQKEIFVGTGTYWYLQRKYTQPYVYGFRVNMSGAEWVLEDLPGWPRPVAYPGMSSPALADLDGDGDLEIIIGSGYSGMSEPGQCSDSPLDPDCHGAVYAWHHNGFSVSGFPMWPKDYMDKNGFVRSSPTVADVDGDGQPEILFAMNWDIIVVGPNGQRETILHTTWSLFASPAVGDLNNDSQTDVVIGGSNYYDSSHGYVYAFTFGSNSYNPGLRPWPMFHRDPRHTGYYPAPPRLRVSPASLYILHQYGSGNTETAQLGLRNIGDGAFNWAVSSSPSGVAVAPSSGRVFYTSTVPLTVTIFTTGYQTGTYFLGNVVITGTNGGGPVQGSPFNVPVTLYVGQVYRAYLPVVLRSAR